MLGAPALNRKALPFILPFVVFVALIPVTNALGLPARVTLVIRLVLPAVVLALCWRGLPKLRVERPAGSVVLGLFVFVLWVAPDLLFPGWRSHWLFQNPVFGRLSVSMPPESLRNPLDLTLRALRACTVVALAEEFFWRGWLMRWLIHEDFQSVPVGAYGLRAFWLTAVFFALEHGPYWEVGLAAGLIYNWWAVRSKSLGDLVLAHGVTNAVLSLFVILTRRWEYWM
jgi:CAAX prenyl protease-like protein